MTVRLFQRKGFWYVEKDRIKRSLKTKDKKIAEKLFPEIQDQDGLDQDQSIVASISGFKIKNKKVTGIVYFIQAEIGGLIKIGYTIDLDKRLRTVQAHSPVPVKVIGTMRGSYEIEQEIHSKFASFRKHGEWFAPSERLLSFMNFHNEPINHNMRSSWEELIEAQGKITLAPASADTG
jgi:hypothetical protein